MIDKKTMDEIGVHLANNFTLPKADQKLLFDEVVKLQDYHENLKGMIPRTGGTCKHYRDDICIHPGCDSGSECYSGNICWHGEWESRE